MPLPLRRGAAPAAVLIARGSMPLPLRRGAAPAAVLIATSAIVVGCAQSEGGALGPEVDPSLPGVGADYDASPVEGTKVPEGGPKEEQDSGSAQPGVDAGPDTYVPPPKPAQGEVLITEVMYDPTGTEPQGEWIEIYNAASSKRMLTGLVLVDGGGRSHSIGVGVTIDAGKYALLVRDKTNALAAQIPAAAILYEYGAGLGDGAGILLANGTTGSVELKNGAAVVASADYGGWYPSTNGSSVQLKVLNYAAAATGTNWCLSTKTWAVGSAWGSPGVGCDCP